MAASLTQALQARHRDQAPAGSPSSEQERSSPFRAGDTPAPARNGCKVHQAGLPGQKASKR